MPANLSDFLLAPSTGRAGLWVQVKNNVTGATLISTTASGADGRFSLPASPPAGDYTVYVSPVLLPANDPGWVITTDTHYQIPYTPGDLDFLVAVRAATQTNQASLTGTPTIDGYATVAGDRILLKAQTTASQNGIWVMGTPWTRPTDFATGTDASGAVVFIEAGSTNGGQMWGIASTGPVIVDTTSQTWTQVSGSGGVVVDSNAADYVPIGNTLAVGATGKAMDAGTQLAHPVGLAQDAHHTAAHADTPAASTTVAAGSNGVDISTFVGSQNLNVAATAAFQPQGTIQVVTAKGTFPVIYTATSGTQFQNCTALGTPPSGSTVATGNSVSTPATHLGPNKVNVGHTIAAVPSAFNLDSQQRQIAFRQDVLNAGVAPIISDDSTNGVASILIKRRDWIDTDFGFLAWSYEPSALAAGQAPNAGGTVQVVKLHAPIAISVTNVILIVQTAGATLTANQNLAALCDANRNVLGVTADQSGVWTSIGLKAMALTGGPFAVSAGDFYIAFFANGTTLPKFLGGALAGATINLGLSAANSRYATADTGRTTSFASPLAALSQAAAAAYWAAVS